MQVYVVPNFSCAQNDCMLKLLALFFLLPIPFFPSGNDRYQQLKEESKKAWAQCQKIARFYDLEEEEVCREITADLLDAEETKAKIKQVIRQTGRRFFVFRYPSGEYQVKGTISFVPRPEGCPMLLFLRGGNRIFGLMNPASRYSTLRDYTVLAPVYRGGVSEGEDEFGGAEVDDVENIVRFLPQLEELLGIHFAPVDLFMLGGSRGGMEMFLALARSTFLQDRVSGAVSLSGLLSMRKCIAYREDMKGMFIRDFGFNEDSEAWIQKRDPILAVDSISTQIPFLIIQGDSDLRVHTDEGKEMIKHLDKTKHSFEYWEFEGGDHCLQNRSDIMEMIADWFGSLFFSSPKRAS